MKPPRRHTAWEIILARIRKAGPLPAVYIAAIGYLFYWVAKSGFLYQFDADELMNLHMAYLIREGWQPFSQYFSVYSPFFHWLLSFALGLTGYGYDALMFSRYVMILLFAVRVGLSVLVIHKIFGKLTAALFLPLLLFDPFTQFTAMQVRPDNLMMVAFTAALASAVVGLMSNSRKWLFASGLTIGIAIITMIKIAPDAAALLGLVTWVSIRRKKSILLTRFILGAVIPIGLFGLYFLLAGSLGQMLNQLLVDAPLTNTTRLYPPRPGSLYLPMNMYIYGTMGRPLVWLFGVLIPLTGAAGLFRFAMDEANRNSRDLRYVCGLFLGILLPVNWIMVQTVKAVFIQYYLPLTWLFVAGTALMCADLIRLVWAKHTVVSRIGLAAILACLGAFYVGAVRANMARSLQIDQSFSSFVKFWGLIPPDAAVFPGYLFRPPAHPVGYGYFFPETPATILNRYPSVIATLEGGKVKYAFISDYMLNFLDSTTRKYIAANYHRVRGYPELLMRN